LVPKVWNLEQSRLTKIFVRCSTSWLIKVCHEVSKKTVMLPVAENNWETGLKICDQWHECNTLLSNSKVAYVCKLILVDFKLSPFFECCILSSEWFTGVCSLNANVSEHPGRSLVGI
jgi:hypothetical protein